MAQGPFSRAEQTMVIASEAKQSVCSAPGGCFEEALFVPLFGTPYSGAEAISCISKDCFAEKRSQ
jgi:hypothetical protein